MSQSLSAGRWIVMCFLGASLLFAAGGCRSESKMSKSKGEATAMKAPAAYRVYVGTYTGPNKGKGIYQFDFNTTTGALKEVGLVAEVESPSFLVLSPDERFLYADGEIDDFAGKKAGAVSAFSVDKSTGGLTLLNQQPSGGAGPCHVSITSDAKTVMVANYGGGSVASFPVQPDGKLGEAASVIQHTGKGTDPGRQEGPHAHGIYPAPGDIFVLACDLGLDKVLIYRRNSNTGALKMENHFGEVPAGGGVRHGTFSPDGKRFYAINEMGNTVTAFDWDYRMGTLKPIQTIGTLPDGYKEKSYTSEIVIHPSGKFLYGSNRGHDSIALFTVDQGTGKLTFVETTPIGGKWPRHFNLDPTGQWLIAAGERSDTLTVFKVDQSTGKLMPAGESVKCPAPACVIFAKQ
jgi:6-phosphogluconolactonase